MATTTDYVKLRTVKELTVTLTYSDTTSAKMFTLPKGARILGWDVQVVTAFSGGTTDLDIGTKSDSDYFVDGADLSAAGQVALGTALKQCKPELTEATGIYMNVGSGNTAGEVKVTCLFSHYATNN